MNPKGTEAEVCRDIADRQKKGMEKYGTTVAENPLSPQEWLQHLYEEGLDQVIYAKRLMAEISWKPIETAPKDGTWILIYGGCIGDELDNRIVTAYWDDDESSVYDPCWRSFSEDAGVYGAFHDTEPTHWMPLPHPPK